MQTNWPVQFAVLSSYRYLNCYHTCKKKKKKKKKKKVVSSFFPSKKMLKFWLEIHVDRPLYLPEMFRHFNA